MKELHQFRHYLGVITCPFQVKEVHGKDESHAFGIIG